MKTTNTQRRCGDDVVGAIMGCVLGKKASGRDDRRDSPSPHPDPPRLSGKQPSATLNSSKTATLEKKEKEKAFHSADFPGIERPRTKLEPYTITHKGWPSWFEAVIGESINDFTPRRANTFEKLDKIGQGTYSNVYKARDLITGKIVALKKVRFDNLEPESVKFMAREIIVLRRLDHPNIIKLEGLVTSRMSCSFYLVFEYMEHDLAGLAASQSGAMFTEPQVKCYMKQLLSGLEYCHKNGVLHRDIKGSNLLIDNDGVLKLADFGLATFYDTNHRQPMTSRVVTLWYRPPELLLGATYYGVGVDLWSAGCILAELLAGKPVLPGRTEVEQLHKIFKLCGSPPEEYWKKYKLPNATLFKPQQPYKRCIGEVFKDFPDSSLSLIETLLSIDPEGRGSATAALNSEFFTAEPYACEPSSLPKYPPSKEMDIKLRDEVSRRQRGHKGKDNAANGARRIRLHEQVARAIPAPEANAELQANIDRWRVMAQPDGKRKSEKFPPPHQDGAVGVPQDLSNYSPLSFNPTDASFNLSLFNPKLPKSVKSTAAVEAKSRRKRSRRDQPMMISAWKSIQVLKPKSNGRSVDLMFKAKRSVP